MCRSPSLCSFHTKPPPFRNQLSHISTVPPEEQWSWLKWLERIDVPLLPALFSLIKQVRGNKGTNFKLNVWKLSYGWPSVRLEFTEATAPGWTELTSDVPSVYVLRRASFSTSRPNSRSARRCLLRLAKGSGWCVGGACAGAWPARHHWVCSPRPPEPTPMFIQQLHMRSFN